MYGIRNCDTVKKAGRWLDRHGVVYRFHDYKTDGADPIRLQAWVDRAGWERLLNRSGTTFRNLPEADKADLDSGRAVALMLDHPSAIRRPVIEAGDALLIGFDAAAYERSLA